MPEKEAKKVQSRNKKQTHRGLYERINLLNRCLSNEDPLIRSVKQIYLIDNQNNSLPYLAGCITHKK